MKKFKSLSIVALVVVLGLTAIVGGYIYTTTDAYKAKQLYNALGDDYTVSQCDSIILNFSTTEYADLAKAKRLNLIRQEREWRGICRKPTLERVQQFKSKYQLTRQYMIAVEEKLDSILWSAAQRGTTQECYQDYLELGKMTRNYNNALHALQCMHALPDASTIASQFEPTITKFYDALSSKETTRQLTALCTDTVARFFYRQNLPVRELETYINKTYHKNVQKRYFKITSDIHFTKAYVGDDKVGYAALFDLQQEVPSKPVRNYNATIIFNTDGKVMYINAQRIFKK